MGGPGPPAAAQGGQRWLGGPGGAGLHGGPGEKRRAGGPPAAALPRAWQPAQRPGSRPPRGTPGAVPSPALTKPPNPTARHRGTLPSPAPPSPARSSSRHFCRAALSLFGHCPARAAGRWGRVRTHRASPPPAPRLLPEQKQLLLEGKVSEEGGGGCRRTGGRVGIARSAALAGIGCGASGSSWEEEAGNDPTRRAQGSSPSRPGQEMGRARAERARVTLLRDGGLRGAGPRRQVPQRGETGRVEKPRAQRPAKLSPVLQPAQGMAPGGFRLRGGSSPEHWAPPGTPSSPRHRLLAGNVCFPVFLSSDSHPQHRRPGGQERGLQLPLGASCRPPLRCPPARRRPSAKRCPRRVGESCRARGRRSTRTLTH